jgi:hypothetical protein
MNYLRHLRDVRFSRRWGFTSWSYGLWRRVVCSRGIPSFRRTLLHTTSLRGVTTYKTTTGTVSVLFSIVSGVTTSLSRRTLQMRYGNDYGQWIPKCNGGFCHIKLWRQHIILRGIKLPSNRLVTIKILHPFFLKSTNTASVTLPGVSSTSTRTITHYS